jgi:hypothetical protein
LDWELNTRRETPLKTTTSHPNATATKDDKATWRYTIITACAVVYRWCTTPSQPLQAMVRCKPCSHLAIASACAACRCCPRTGLNLAVQG